MKEKRKQARNFTPEQTIIKKRMPDGSFKLHECKNRNISRGGVFIITENLSIFELGEVVEVKIKDTDRDYYKGKAEIIRSESVFNKDSVKTECGYGIVFLSQDV
jgi:hypothetical protein